MSVLPLAHPCPSQGDGEGSDGDDRTDTLARLRKRMAVLSGMPDRPSADRSAEVDDSLPLPDVLADLLPRGQSAGRGGIARGSVVGCSGARSLVVAMIAAVSRGGGQVGIVGLPWLNLLSAAEMGADAMLKATQVDGVYSADPKLDPSAVRYDRLTHAEAIQKDLKVMDTAAFALARDSGLNIIVFSLRNPGCISAVLKGEGLATLVTP